MSCVVRQPQEPAAASAPAEPAAAAVVAAEPASARSAIARSDGVEPSGIEPRPQLRIETGPHSAFVRRIAVAAHVDRVVTASDDKTARVWDLATGELRQVLRPAIGHGEIGRLYGVATHPRDDLVAVGGTTGERAGEHRILLYAIGSGALVRSFDARGGDIRKLAWSPDGSVLLAAYAGEHALRAFDADGVLLHEQPFAAPSYGLAVAADGTVAASSFDGQVVVVRAGERRVTAAHSFRTRTAEPVGLAFSPDGSRLVVGFRTAEQAPEVYEAATGRYLFKLAQPPVQAGSHRTVAWSDDGKTIAVGGSGYNRQHKFPVFFHDAASGRLVAQQEVGNDTIYDLVALPGNRFAYASGDGSWGVVGPHRLERSVEAAIADLKGAGNLHVDGTGRRVAWTHAWGREPASFDFTRRIVATGSAAAAGNLLAPKARRGLFDSSVWENAVSPSLNGRPVALGPAEVSRAVAYFRNGSGAVLGTSHRLMRLDDDNQVSWEVRNADEVRSVNITGDDRMIVTGMSDGTLRWWRAADGRPLMSLLATRDKRWVAWTPEGYFDASAGADRLVGWTVNRAGEPVADHFSLNRFRERFNRPDLIDEVLRTATPVAALDPAIVTRVARTPAQSLQFPPVVSPINLGTVEVADSQMKVPVEVRADHQVRLEVRVDGRPVEADIVPAPAAAGGTAALATLPRPAPGSIVQVIAQDQNGVSEPAGFFVDPGSRAAAADSIPAPSSQQQTGLYVLAIGISEYQRPEYKLGFAAKDARDFADAMVSQRDRLYRQVQARTLVDKQATLPAILAGLEWLTDQVKAGDLGMLFLAGHGMNSANGQYYFLPHEGNHRQLAETGLPESAIRNTLGRMRGKALFFVDTCYGGNVVGTASRELARLANDLAATENGVVVFASSSGRQLSEENTAWGNGAFTKAVLAGLAGEADLTNTGRITFKGLDFYISEEVNKLTAGRQTPVTISPLGVPDFAIARVGD
jgi:WD40 repeat protein